MFKLITTLALTLASAAAFAAVDLNKADQATLETVKGIGPALSTKLLDERKKGSFKDWADVIERVGGVGAGSAARLSAAGLTVGDKAYTAAAPGAEVVTAKVPRKASDKTSDKASDQASDKATAKAATKAANKAATKGKAKDPAQATTQRAERPARKDAAKAEGKSPRRSAKAQPPTTAPAAATMGPALR